MKVLIGLKNFDMRTFELKGSKERVKIGDYIYKKNNNSMVTIIKVTRDNIDDLINQGIIIEKKPINLSYEALKRAISDRTKIPLEVVDGVLSSVNIINSSTLCSLLLKEIAIILNRQYNSDIRGCEYLYIISKLDGSIKKLPTKNINVHCFNNIAVFRTKEEAEIAIKVVREIFNEYFE